MKNFNVSQVITDSLATRHIIKLEGNNTLEVIIFKGEGREIRFIHDNFPGQRRFFSTNIPYTSIEDFESDLNRMKINARKEVKP